MLLALTALAACAPSATTLSDVRQALADAKRPVVAAQATEPAVPPPSPLPVATDAPVVAVAAPPAVVSTPPPAPPPAPPTAAPPVHRHVEWGVYVPGFPGNAAAIDGVEHAAGRHVDVVMWYVHWGGQWSAFNPGDVRTVIARGSTPMITWMSDDPSASSQDAYTARVILSGRYDSYIRAWAAGLRDAGAPVRLRYDHEMNGNWSAWSPGTNGQTSADFVAMWRHVHDIFAAAGATNVQWVWSPNVAYQGSTPLAGLYPGDAYVDRIGVDGYNWGASDRNHTWQSFAGVFDGTLAQVAALTSKPVALTEVASTEAGGDKAAWIADFFTSLSHHASIEGFVWFDADKETDWRIDSSSPARSAFAAGLLSVS